MPYDPNTCTFTMGTQRQQLYACLTCLEASKNKQPAAVCYSCSIQCHSTHELVELFTKRFFTCDCGTTRMNHPCKLRDGAKDDIPSSDNKYNHNFKGRFCECDKPYDPNEETGNMLQCILGDECGEDWYHDYCILGVNKPEKVETPVKEARKENPLEGVNQLDSLGEPGEDASTDNIRQNGEGEYEEQEEDEENILDGFPSLDEFENFICWKCVAKHREFFSLIKDDENIVFTIVERVDSAANPQERIEILNKEKGGLLQLFKKRKIDHAYSVFLKPNHETNFKNLLETSRDETVLKFLKKFKYLTDDLPVYEPMEDNDDNSSIFDLGAKAISSLPREQAIQGVQAYEDIKTKLKDFLKPFAENGTIVDKKDIDEFFKSIK